MSKKIFRKVAPIAGAVLGSTILPGLGFGLGSIASGAIGSSLGSLAAGNSLKDAAIGGVGSYLGGSLATNILGGSLGTIGSNLGASNAITDPWMLSPTAGVFDKLVGNIAGTNLATAMGSYAGNSIATDMVAPEPKAPAGPAPFKPSREDEAQLPSSLSSFSTLNPKQRSSNLATQGVYGGGLGPEEERYFLNNVNRELMNEDGTTDELGALGPIEMSYLQQLGLGGQANSNSLLEAISKWKKQAA